MKPTILLTLSVLLFAFSTTYIIPLAFSQVPDLVKDINGIPLSSDGKYYVLPAIWGPTGGGVSPRVTGNQTCPVTVLQSYYEVENGKGVKFEHFPNIGIIYEGVPLKIYFANIYGYCAESTEWVVVSDDFPTPWVGIGGAADHPGKQIVSGLFDIQKYDNFSYKLVFTHINGGSPGRSIDIGRRDDKNGRRLILAQDDDYTFHVVFVRANDDAGINGIKSVV
ncbi:kunitz-type trypsin inhibitor-like 2 protein [Lotus japonicus]|uniref:kunitz-type trypsin inhibitor-like 2 protein n=1 Tax=Lotus japonicus TaxID=34305 RepID=UPI002590337D|nr:kunitz-type trypsin inhibitor-like 2 protein [Lotus japonicus]